MKYFELSPKDQRQNTWILYKFIDWVQLRDRYLDLRCPWCRKVDELPALERGIDTDVRVASKADYVMSHEGFILFSARLLALFASEGVKGFRTFPLPGDDRYVVAWPDPLIATDRSQTGIEVHGEVCPTCQRPHETCFLPRLSSLQLPTERKVLFASEVWVEKSKGRHTWFTTTEDVVAIMKANEITGVEYDQAH